MIFSLQTAKSRKFCMTKEELLFGEIDGVRVVRADGISYRVHAKGRVSTFMGYWVKVEEQ